MNDNHIADERKKGDKATCGACNGTGWMVRDPDIGTDQECFACDGSGVFEDAPIAPRADALYTMDQMRAYAMAFHKSRLERIRPRSLRADADTADHAALIAETLHWPEHWDTAAYPDVWSALQEVMHSFQCSECRLEPESAAGASNERADADTAGAKPDMQAFAEKVRNGMADYVADNMPDRKHSLEEIDLYIRKIEINADMLAATPASSVADAAGANIHERFGNWLKGPHARVQTMLDAYAAGASERADAEKDAARYQWLRGEHFPTAFKPPVAQVIWKRGSVRHSHEWANLIDGNDLDNAIDAAILAAIKNKENNP
jgi:hypothetical protein